MKWGNVAKLEKSMCGRITLFLFQGFGVEALNWDLHRLRHKNILDKPGHEVPVHIARIKAMAPCPCYITNLWMGAAIQHCLLC